MSCHERTVAALNLQQPDRVPVFSCTEEQNQNAVAAVRICEGLLR